MGDFIRRSHRVVYENPWIRFEVHEIVHPSGAPGEHGLMTSPGASAVVAIDGREVILTRQKRFAAGIDALEVVKGGRDENESALAAAQREMREEIGMTATQWNALGIGWELPSIVEPPVAIFLARGLTAVQSDQEAVEAIGAVRLPFAAALDAVETGGIDDAITALALMRARRFIERGG